MHTTQRRWEEVAALVAQAVDRDVPLGTSMVEVERAAGLRAFEGEDPSPQVSARRFARAYAAAQRDEHRRFDAVLDRLAADVASRLSTGSATSPRRAAGASVEATLTRVAPEGRGPRVGSLRP